MTGIVRALALIAAALGFSAALAQPDPYPSRQVKIVVGFPPGGINDIVARVLGVRMTESMGQPVLVENRPGASGTIGVDYVAKSKPDGYTLVLGSVSNMAMAMSQFKSLPYDTLRDFAPVTLAAAAPNILVAHPGFAPKSVKELIELSKQKPGVLAYGSAGSGTSNHLTVELLKSITGVDIVHVPYKGDAPAVQDTVGGQIPFMFATLPVVLQHIRGGKLRALAVSSIKRSALLPEVPTVSESGIANFEVSVWVGILAPAGTPKEIVARLNAEIVRIVNTPAVREHLAGLGVESFGNAPEQFAQIIAADIAKWGQVAKRAGIQPN
ncbi:MAG: tripartite tricarboxylate transporter substrate binding protein [Betaproteobacteria bacterium]|nr:tripartite tricarboxylate transporter substrate binding protein [Betaproteobacteria bacterium]